MNLPRHSGFLLIDMFGSCTDCEVLSSIIIIYSYGIHFPIKCATTIGLGIEYSDILELQMIHDHIYRKVEGIEDFLFAFFFFFFLK